MPLREIGAQVENLFARKGRSAHPPAAHVRMIGR
jgi:hypothetical protein